MPSLDPRVNRFDLSKQDQAEVKIDTQWITWEVFHQVQKGKQCVHVGIVHAPNPELALVFAKEQYARRGRTTNLWVTKTTDVYTTGDQNEDLYKTTPGKTFREPGFYKVRDRIQAYQNRTQEEKA